MSTAQVLTARVCAALLGLTLASVAPAQQPIPVALTPQQREILGHMSLVQLPDGLGGTRKTLRISGVNVQIVNGTGATATTNGLGNLIVGYNELGNPFGDDRTGSHNIVGGRMNTFSSAGGLVVGDSNGLWNLWASVSGGKGNSAFGDSSSVSGGLSNVASGYASSVSGGNSNQASGNTSSVSGGGYNGASGTRASVSGGFARSAGGIYDWAAGGLFQTQ